MKNRSTIKIETLCTQGPIRKNNEDAIFYDINEELNIACIVIADGMGGHKAGEVASTMLLDQIETAWLKLDTKENISWRHWIEEQLNSANLSILNTAQNNVHQKGMGTTGVLVVIDKNECHIGWVGDSRAYSQKNNKLIQETVDHTMLQELVNKGAISVETARNSNTKNLLSQAIGVQEKISVDTKTISINNSDVIMLSTDGVHDYLTEQEISDYLSMLSSKKDICHDIIEKAITNKSRDNLTVGLITFAQ